MRESLKVALRISEVKERLNHLGGLSGDDLTEEHRAEIGTLTNEYTELETRARALMVAEDEAANETTTEGGKTDTEFRSMVDKARLSDIVDAALGGRATDGATRELQDELGLDSAQVPLELLEVRTAGQTSAPSDTGAVQHPIIPAVFPRAAAAYLGVEMPSVPVGDSTFTLLSTSLKPGTPAAGDDQAHSAGAFTAKTVAPKRVQGSFFIRREDRARLAGMEEALRENLSAAISDKMDSEIIANGFLASSGGIRPKDGDKASTTAKFSDYLSLLYGEVDGIYANMASDVRLLFGSDTYAHAGSVYRSNNADYNAVDALTSKSGGLRVSAHIPAAATVDSVAGNALVIAAKDVSLRHAVAPVWQGPTLIVDEVTQAKAGEIVITMVALWGGFNLIRSAAYAASWVKIT